MHEHNLLPPIVSGDDPELLYPIFVFRVLTLPRHDGPSPRAGLVDTFDAMLEDTMAHERRALGREIVYGPGGIYDEALLRLHQELLRELGATLDSFARDIDLLTHQLALALEEDFEGSEVAPATPQSALQPLPEA